MKSNDKTQIYIWFDWDTLEFMLNIAQLMLNLVNLNYN